MKTCKKTLAVRRFGGAATGIDVVLPMRTAEATLRAVDASGAGVAFTIRLGDGPEFHMSAGEALTMDGLLLSENLTLRVTSPAGSFVELLLWEG